METDGFGALAQSLYFIQKARVQSQVKKSHLEKQDKICGLTDEVLTRTGDEDVITLCEKYIQELEKAVKDGVSKGFITGQNRE